MTHILGTDPFATEFQRFIDRPSISQSATLPPEGSASHSVGIPVCDETLFEPASLYSYCSDELRGLLTNRSTFRAFCESRRIPIPVGKAASSFDKASQYVIARNRFPLVMKSERNSSWGEGIFRLEGFRELSRFYEKIQHVEPGPVLIEDWLTAQAWLEITEGPGQTRLISQVSLDKRLSVRPLWRMFPAAIPKRYQEQIDAALRPFQLLRQGPMLLRFSFALTATQAVLLSVGAGINRLEYLPDWCEPFGVTSILGAVTSTPAAAPGALWKYGRIQLFYRSGKDAAWPRDIPRECSGARVLQFVTSEKRAAVLLGGNDPTHLSAAARVIGTHLARAAEADEQEKC
jgi:hypothetical protein